MPSIDLSKVIQESMISTRNNKHERDDEHIYTESNDENNFNNEVDKYMIEPIKLVTAGAVASKFLTDRK